jgi:hypothetical protein
LARTIAASVFSDDVELLIRDGEAGLRVGGAGMDAAAGAATLAAVRIELIASGNTAQPGRARAHPVVGRTGGMGRLP